MKHSFRVAAVAFVIGIIGFLCCAKSARTESQGYMLSPINLSRDIAFSTNLDGPDLENYRSNGVSLVLDSGGNRLRQEGRRVAFRALGNHLIFLDGRRYRLEYVDVKAVSDHTIAWQHYPVELQFVHSGEDGHYVMISVFVDLNHQNQSSKHAELEPLVRAMRPNGSPRVDHVNLLALLPETQNFYRYEGRLPSNPEKTVTHVVCDTAVLASYSQIDAIENTVDGNNNAPTQSPDGREVFYDTYSDD